MEDGIQVSDKQVNMKRCSISLDIKEMHITTMVIYYYTPIRTIVILKNTKINAVRDVKKLDLSYVAGENVKQSRHSRK